MLWRTATTPTRTARIRKHAYFFHQCHRCTYDVYRDEHIPSQSSKEDLDTYEASFIDDEDMSGEEDTADDSPSPTRGKGKILVKE